MAKNKRVDMDTRPLDPLRRNLDYGEGPFFGTPGGGEKSMGDWIKKHREKRKKNFKALLDGKFDVLRASTIFLQKVAFMKEAAPEDVLNTIPAADEVKQFILQQPKEHIGPYIGALKKNPAVGVEELQKVVRLPKEREGSFADEVDRDTLKFVPIKMLGWARIQLLKSRNRDPKATEDKYNKWKDLGYWFRSRQGHFGNRVTFDQVIDWFDATSPDLASLNFKQVEDATIKWHEEQAVQGLGNEYQEGNSNIVYGPQWKNPGFNGWTIRKITTKNDLEVEGNRMNHCVGSYCEDVKNKNVDIYSLRDPQNEPHVTMEANGGTYEFRQIMGKSNSDPKLEYKSIIKEWIKTLPNALGNLSEVSFNTEEIPVQEFAQKLHEAFSSEDEYGLPINITSTYGDEFNTNIIYTNIISRLHEASPSGFYYSFMNNIAKELAKLTVKHDRAIIVKYNNDTKFDDLSKKYFFEIPKLFKSIESNETETKSLVSKDHNYPQLPFAFNQTIINEINKELQQNPFPNYEWLRDMPIIQDYLAK